MTAVTALPAPLGDRDSDVARLRAFLARPEGLTTVFQPIVALATGRVVGYEALARLPLPQLSIGEWFALAGEEGLGVPLERAALFSALAVDGRLADTFLSVNASPEMLRTRDLQRVLPSNLSGLVIEITEQPDDALDEVADVLERLRDRGARVAVDDTGAGYAGLHRLLRLQPDIIKLDRALVRHVDHDPAKQALVEALVGFARRTGAFLCAEGIETAAELAVLADLDVGLGQGFLLGRPAPAWSDVSPAARHTCAVSLSEALRVAPGSFGARGARRLEAVCRLLGGLRTRDDVATVTGELAALLHADAVALSAYAPETQEIVAIAGHAWVPSGERYDVRDYPVTARVLAGHDGAQILVTDPAADPAEVALLAADGYGSLLMVPLVSQGQSVGLLEAYVREPRPWTRTEISRARVLATHLGAVVLLLR